MSKVFTAEVPDDGETEEEARILAERLEMAFRSETLDFLRLKFGKHARSVDGR